jgi:hypothetical protein
MRSLVLLLGALLYLGASPCRAERFELSPLLELPQIELSLVPRLEEPQIEEPQLPLTMREATVPPHLVMVGRVRGAMLDRCRARMRSVVLIGHGASTDGRPDTCRLLSFVGRTKYRERAMKRRAGVRSRFLTMSIDAMPELPHFLANIPGPIVVARTLGVPRASTPGRLPLPPAPAARLVW